MARSPFHDLTLKKYFVPRRKLATCSVGTPLLEAIALLLHQPVQVCGVTLNCVAIAEQGALLGFVTLDNVLQLIAENSDWAEVSVQRMMTDAVEAIVLNQTMTIYQLLDHLHRHQLFLLPVVDEAGQWQGLFTRCGLQQHFLQADNAMLGLRHAADVMTTEIAHLDATTPLVYAAQMLGRNQQDYVVATALDNSELAVPLGFVAATTVIQAALSEVAGDRLMIVGEQLEFEPIKIAETDSLASVVSVIATQRQPWLLVMGEQNEWQGVITQAALLEFVDPVAPLWRKAGVSARRSNSEKKDLLLTKNAPLSMPAETKRRSPYQVLLLENSGQDSAILMHLLEPPQTIDLSFQVTQVDGLEVALSQLAAHTYDLLLV
ncbi:MAG: CBS domain-containing protein, partial [Limnothrix sp.]